MDQQREDMTTASNGKTSGRSNRVWEARMRGGLTRAELVDATGFSSQLLSAYETHKKEPSVSTSQSIAKACGTSTAYVLGYDIYPSWHDGDCYPTEEGLYWVAVRTNDNKGFNYQLCHFVMEKGSCGFYKRTAAGPTKIQRISYWMRVPVISGELVRMVSII